MASEIIVVSGLPRSGTSLMMQMLDKGGVSVVIDNVRTADTDNPKGYYEFEKVKQLKQDATWLPATRGKVFKMVSQLLYDLPPSEKYRIIFLERDLQETLITQEKMLARLGRPCAPRDQIQRAYSLHLERLRDWLSRQPNLIILRVNYNDLIEHPRQQAERVSAFLDGKLNVEEMVNSVDPSLYRNRKVARIGDSAH
jgi:hypothetical protein